MSDNERHDPKTTAEKLAAMSRRDTFKLATAVSALGVGLGATLKANDVHAEIHKLEAGKVGALTVKLYKWNEKSAPVLLHTADLSQFTVKLAGPAGGPGLYAIKFFHTAIKGESVEASPPHVFEIVSQKG